MRATRTTLRRGGPFLIPARTLLLASGLIAVALGVFTLLHEYHSHQVDGHYTTVAVILGVIWLASLVLAFLGFRMGVFLAAALAFIDFGVTATGHFETASPGSMGAFARSEGLPVATAAMGLICACVLTVVSSAVAWGDARGRARRLETLPLLLVAVVGAVLVVLQATDGVHRDNFGSANTEDGALIAALTASLWVLGGLFIARARRVGALIIVLATFIVWYSFFTLHLLKGGISLSAVASRSGVIWAVFSASASILAAASFLVALALFAVAVVQRLRSKSASPAPVARRARG
jgi:hypothetical protein